MRDDEKPITVFYDGACPRCVHDRENYERLAGEAAREVGWLDITGREETLRAEGIDPDAALRELHVRAPDGRIMRELDAYILLMSRVPRLKPLAWLISLPGLRGGFSWLYRTLVLRRLRRSGRIRE